MRRMRPLVVLIAVTCAAPCTSYAQGGGGGTDAPLYTEDDLRFLQQMIAHHQQAVDMARLVRARSERVELVRFAEKLGRTQAAEIEQMQSLLDLAAARGQTLPEHASHASHEMPGMLSRAQLEALAPARGGEFERLWLEGMIYHHEGALTMAAAQQRRQLESGRRPYGIDVLVEEIVEVQRAEIAQMRAWLGAGAGRPAPG